MFCKLMKAGAVAFVAGAAVGAASAMWLMSDAGKPVRDELRDLAHQAKEKMQSYCDQVKQEAASATAATAEA